MTAWANEVIRYAPAPGVTDTPGYPAGSPALPNNIASRGLGPADGQTVSLGALTRSPLAATDLFDEFGKFFIPNSNDF